MNWTAVGAMAGVAIPIGGIISWSLFGLRARLVYDIVNIQGNTPDYFRLYGNRIQALQIRLVNASLRHASEVQIRVSDVRNLVSAKAVRATSLDIQSIVFSSGDSGLRFSIPNFPSREEIVIDVFHDGWVVIGGGLSGGSTSYRIMSRDEYSLLKLKIFFGFVLLFIPTSFVIGALNG